MSDTIGTKHTAAFPSPLTTNTTEYQAWRMSRPRIRALLIDLSGTLHIGKEPTSSAVSALRRLREAGIPFRFCSNTSKESTHDLRNRLRGIGFEVKDGELWTSLGALSDLVRSRQLKKPYFLLSQSAMKEFPEHAYTDVVPTTTTTSSSSSFVGAKPHSEYDAVVVGLAPELFTYVHLTFAFRILLENPGAQFIVTHRARYVRTSDGELSLGPGPFVAALEDALGGGGDDDDDDDDNGGERRRVRKAEVVGKPSRAFYERCLESLVESGELEGTRKCKNEEEMNVDWDDVAIVGDDVHADLGAGAIELGLWRVLVKTGKYRPGDETRVDGERPNEVYESFAAFVESLLEHGDG